MGAQPNSAHFRYKKETSMHHHSQHLFPTSEGISLAGVIIAKRNADGSLNMSEQILHAQLQAAYGKMVTPQALRYVTRGCELLGSVLAAELEHLAYPFSPNPYIRLTTGDNYSDLAKALMMFALSGLNDIEDVETGKQLLLKMQHAPDQDALLKSYGLPTLAALRKAASDTLEEAYADDPLFNDEYSAEGADAALAIDPDFEAKHPRWQAGDPEGRGGEFREKDGYATRDDGSIIRDPKNQKPIMIPPGVSLHDNIDFGRQISDLPSVLIGSPYDGTEISQSLSNRETAMVALFIRNGAMDYQRLYSNRTDSEGNSLINRNYIDFGNYNYGAVGAAAGYELFQLLRLGAILNITNFFNDNIDIVRDPATADAENPWLSNPRVNRFVTLGYQDYISGKIKGNNRNQNVK